MKKKFNSIDVLIVVVILAVLAGGIYYLSHAKNDDSGIVTGKRQVTFIAEATEILPAVCDQIKVGDTIVAMNTLQDGKIVKVESFDTRVKAAVGNEIVTLNDPTTKTLRVTIEASVNQYGPYMDFGGQEIKAGAQYWIKTETMHALGNVVNVIEEEAAQ